MPIKIYLNQTVKIQRKTGLDKYGEPVVGTQKNLKCRFQEKATRFLSERGDEIITDAELWVNKNADIENGDMVVVSGVNYEVVRVDTKRGFNGNEIDHIKCLLKRIP